ncbi:MAG TPA: hypothetical protein VMT89_03275, partial [Candidatus Acidoferrales bacterium]|nr:hypothetical protein [Candidatus Acidoferrales bacterium]
MTAKLTKFDSSARHPRSKVGSPTPRTLQLAGTGLIVAATLCAYWPALHAGFTLDDNLLLTENPLVKAPDGLWRIWRILQAHNAWPMTDTSFWIEWHIWHLNPAGYHATNLALHGVTILLLALVLRKLAIPGVFLAVLLFAVHPVNVQSVAWIAQRKNLLAMLFCLLSVLWFLRSTATTDRDRSGVDRYYCLSLIAFVFAMLSKGSAAILPLVLAGMMRWHRRLTTRDLLRLTPFLSISSILVPLNIWLQANGMNPPVYPLTLIDRILGAAAVVWFYLFKALWPLQLSFI